MSAVHREWVNAQADRVVLVVDQVASVKSAPAHQPKRIASVSRAAAGLTQYGGKRMPDLRGITGERNRTQRVAHPSKPQA